MIWLGVEMSTSNNTQPPQPPGPEVLFERRESAKKLLGNGYEAAIGGLKVAIRELAREKGLSLELAYCELEATRNATPLEIVHLGAALFECMADSEQAGFESRQEEAKVATKPQKAPKPPPPPSWIRQIGRGHVVRATFLAGPSVEDWRAACRNKKAALGLLQPRVEGVCEIGCARLAEFEDLNQFSFGEYIVFGWVVQTRKVNTKTLQAECERRIREARKKAEAAGEKFKKGDRDHIKNDCKDELLRQVVPNTLVHPVVIDPARGIVWFHGSEEAWERFKMTFMYGFQRSRVTDKLDVDLINMLGTVVESTDLRKTEALRAVPTKAKATSWMEHPYRDLLLWLLLTSKPASTGLSRGNACGRLTWAVDDLVIETASPRNELRIAGGDSGAVMAALAEGGTLKHLELSITQEVAREGESVVERLFCYEFTVKALKDNKTGVLVGKPTVLPVGSSIGEWSGAVTERILSFELLHAILKDIVGEFAIARASDQWQAVVDAGRKWVGLELMRRFAFDEASGQGWLFKPQALLPVVTKEEKKARSPKGGK